MNRLAQETSPYLLQHRHNPVAWFPWGEEAFAKARAEDKPILLSVGYSACHWCHVMAHESFEDEETAALMNAHFVNVKVDREERPDVDALYMSAVQAMTGAGGWPMTVVMTPAGEPFFGGTYFPKDDRYGHPAFKRVLRALAQAWQARRDDVLASAESMRQYLTRLGSLGGEGGELSRQALEQALSRLAASFDAQHGGFGGAPKFPPHSVLRLLLRQDARYREMALVTLRKMARGGIYDQLGGGFARYSVDERWLVPHFEKMLYDNAQLIARYSEAFRLTHEDVFRDVVEETVGWLTREMTSAEGGFYSALDADSEGEEGKFYLWDAAEFDAVLGEDAAFAKRYFGVSEAGNFEGRTILTSPEDPQAVADALGLTPGALAEKLAGVKARLLERRELRVRPGLDDKILTSWNGLMLGALAEAGRVFGREDWLELARRNARFLREKLYRNGRLRHSYKGEARVEGLLEDYAYLGLGLVSLYRATFESEWLLWALELAKAVLEHFADTENGGFFSTPDDGEALITRLKNHVDSPNPSENAAAAELLLTLARYTDQSEWEQRAAEAIRPLLAAMQQQPSGFGTLMCVLEHLLAPPREIALFGDPEDEATQALLTVVNEAPRPYTAVALVQSPDDPLVSQLPFLQHRDRLEGKATVYVCEGGACRLPVTTAEALSEQLGSG